jgi:calcineurin-like phosphoesterase family protein
MNVFFTADLHLGHDNIRRHCRRPFATVEEMDEAIIANWNGAVASKDLVYVVGDFAWRNHGHHLARLKGKKVLIKGNHDKMSQDCLRNFTEVHQLLARTIDKRLVVMCLYCMVVWPSSCHGAWHLYGHSHGRIRELPDVPPLRRRRRRVGLFAGPLGGRQAEARRKKVQAQRRHGRARREHRRERPGEPRRNPWPDGNQGDRE